MGLGIGLKRMLLLIGDYAVFQVALLLTLLFRYGGVTHTDWTAHAIPFSILGVLWIATYYINGLYDLELTRDNLRLFRTFLESMLINLGIAFTFFYLIPIFGIAPRTNLILFFALTLFIGYAWRLLFNQTLAPSLFQHRLLFIGTPDEAARLNDLLMTSALGFTLVAVVETAQGTHFDSGSIAWVADINRLADLITEKHIQVVVLGHRPDDVPGLREALYRTLFTPVALMDRAALEETVTGRVPLEYVSQTWFLEHLREGEKAWYESVKRIADVALAIPFGVLTVGLYPFITALIKLSSPGPVLYSQIRVGKLGKPFRIWKFRTMRTDAEKNGPQFTADAKTDPRLFTAGRILRQLRIDELPQIWNVLRGDLSLIGPRPERPEFVEQLTAQMPFYTLRNLTRPGLTGWAQTHFLMPTASLDDNLKKLQYDLFYIKHRSILLDLAILLKTVGIVLRRQGT